MQNGQPGRVERLHVLAMNELKICVYSLFGFGRVVEREAEGQGKREERRGLWMDKLYSRME
jgi:hypothetical protein